MNKIFLTNLFVIIFLSIGETQNFSVENTSLNYAYPAIGNCLNIVIENESCEVIIVKTDNGKISKIEDNENSCLYNFIPKSVGIATLEIYKILDSDTLKIGERNYRIKNWPAHRAKIGTSESGKMSKARFLAHGGIIVPLNFNDTSGQITVNSFRIEVVRDEEMVLNLANKGGKFEPKNQDELKNIKEGDLIFIKEIMVTMPGESNETKLNEIKIEIEN